MQLWHVQLFNDDFNMREHVSRTLMMVADLSAEEARARRTPCLQSAPRERCRGTPRAGPLRWLEPSPRTPCAETRVVPLNIFLNF